MLRSACDTFTEKTRHVAADAAAAKSDVVAIAAGSRHCVALKRDGSIVTWGATGFPKVGVTTVPAGLQHLAQEQAEKAVTPRL